MSKPHIRWMIRRDMPEVLAIEAEAYSPHWTEDEFIRCLRQRNCIGMVADVGLGSESEVVAFMLYELHKSRLKLLKLAVHPFRRREGIGSTMLDKIKTKLSVQRRTDAAIDVADDNLVAHLFLRSNGFRAKLCGEDLYRFSYRVESMAGATP